MTYHICTFCQRSLEETKFYTRSNGHRDGRCRVCRNVISGLWRKSHPEKNNQYHRRYYNARPWEKNYDCAYRRCNDKHFPKYSRYGGRGVRFLLSRADFRFMWFRDFADRMERPSIDRVDNDGDYTLENCHFIEYRLNSRKRNKNLGIIER